MQALSLTHQNLLYQVANSLKEMEENNKWSILFNFKICKICDSLHKSNTLQNTTKLSFCPHAIEPEEYITGRKTGFKRYHRDV